MYRNHVLNDRNRTSYSKILKRLNKNKIIEHLSFYGFVECERMTLFLSVVVDDFIDMASYRYLLANINECINNHAKGYNDAASLMYFRPLYKLRDEIEYITSVSM